MAPVRRKEWIGFLMGALLYPVEVVLVSLLKESPAIEIMVCRKRRPAGKGLRDAAECVGNAAGGGRSDSVSGDGTDKW